MRNSRTHLAGRGRKNGSLWTRLFDQENIGVVKHERNLQLLEQFSLLTKNTWSQVGRLIHQLTSFKSLIDDLQETNSSLEYSSSFSIEEQKHRLR